MRATDYDVPVPSLRPFPGPLCPRVVSGSATRASAPHPDGPELNDNIGLSAEALTLGEFYQAADHQTAAIGKWHLGPKPHDYPMRHGFDDYYGILCSNDMLPILIMDNDEVVENPADQRLIPKNTRREQSTSSTATKTAPSFSTSRKPRPTSP